MQTARASHAIPHKFGTLMFTSALLVIGSGLPVRAQTITDINPSQSTLAATDPDGATGGRVNHVGMARSKSIIFAASEWGGIYKSIDLGQTWTHMDGHHPTVTWDVKVSPTDNKRVVATSFYDGRVNSLAGINVSTDGGVNWTHPASATPPDGFCLSIDRRTETAAYGISFDPANPQNVYVGTNCGVAISNDAGNTWHYVDPTPADKADDVWAVVVHHGGTIDTCGDDGHRRSTDGGATWISTSGSGIPLPGGICSIAASPDESYVLFAVVGTTIFESDNGGGSWANAYTNPRPQGRIPFVKTNSRGSNKYDLWFGDVSLFRGSCTTPSPAAPGGSQRCQPSTSWAGGFTRSNGAHDDMGDIAFDPFPGTKKDTTCQDGCRKELDFCMKTVGKPGGSTPQQCVQELKLCLKECPASPPIKLDACPLIMSSDGGVFVNQTTTTPACQSPSWRQPKVTPHGLWAFGMNGTHAASGPGQLLYFGAQDDGTFASTNAQTAAPAWTNRDCCDSFDVAVDTGQVLYTVCCFGGRANRLFLRGVGMSGGAEINTYPAGNLAGFRTPDIVDRFGTNSYVLLTTSGVFITTNITATPAISWSPLGTRPVGACAVHAAVSGVTPSFFVEAGSCTGSSADQIWRYNGTGSGGTWQQVNPPSGSFGFGVFAVDKKNPDRLFASILVGASVEMVFSTNGGTSWSNLSTLDTAMTGGGVFKYRNTNGPTDFTGFSGYVQPTLVAFSPFDTRTLVAAGADSGIFLSKNTGATWQKVTDNSGTAANPHVPRAKFASFDHGSGLTSLFIGTQGRGVWRANFPDTGGPCLQDCQDANKQCVDGCDTERDDCMKDVGKPGGLTPQQCVQLLKACLAECKTDLTQCKQKCQ